VIRLLLLLLGSVSVRAPGRRLRALYGAQAQGGGGTQPPPGSYPGGTGTVNPPPGYTQPLLWPAAPAQAWAGQPAAPTQPQVPWHPTGPAGPPPPSPRRRRVPRWVKWGVVAAVIAVIFRRVVTWLVLTALSASLHFLGFNVHLPHIRFGWPWQSITAGTATNTQLGPWVLQKIEGISRPALGQATFTFYFTHKVSKNVGPLPCWYSSTFYAVGHASATVNLNPGPSWWKQRTGHYQMQILSRPHAGKPGQVAVTMVLPAPQLPQSAHAVTIDNIPSKPLSTDHSWTYPGMFCGVALRPNFPDSVLYAQAQQIAYYKATHVPSVTGPLLRSAESEATQTIRTSFIQPAVNAFGYRLDRLTLRWAPSH
jgi:hypothetical protein